MGTDYEKLIEQIKELRDRFGEDPENWPDNASQEDVLNLFRYIVHLEEIIFRSVRLTDIMREGFSEQVYNYINETWE